MYDDLRNELTSSQVSVVAILVVMAAVVACCSWRQPNAAWFHATIPWGLLAFAFRPPALAYFYGDLTVSAILVASAFGFGLASTSHIKSIVRVSAKLSIACSGIVILAIGYVTMTSQGISGRPLTVAKPYLFAALVTLVIAPAANALRRERKAESSRG